MPKPHPTRTYKSKARRSPAVAVALRSLGTRVQKLRNERELSQEEAAHRAKLDPKHLQAIEGGRVNVTVASLLGIARCLKVSLSELFEDVR